MNTAARTSTAFLTTALALVLTLAFFEFLSGMRLFFFWVAVLVTALIAGTNAGLLATGLSCFAALFVVFAPRGELGFESGADALRLTMFALFAGGVSIAAGRTRNLAMRLRASELRYRTLVVAAPARQAIWTATPDGQVNWAPEWAAITGQRMEELEAGEGMKAVHPDDATRTWQRWSEAVAAGTRYEDEIRVRVASGRYRWFSINAAPVRANGKAITEWVGLIVDIHDRKRHEEDAAFINRASELLSSTLAASQAMRNLARLCVPALGDWCTIYLGNDENYQRIVAEHPDPSRHAPLMQLDPRRRPPPDRDPIVRVLRSGKPELVRDAAEADVLTPDQEALVRELGLRSWIVAPMIARGRTLGAMAVISGESGRHYEEDDVPLVEELARRAGMALDNARLYEDAEAANRAKDEFLATLSHELRTPLTAISGWAHMLQLGIGDEETRQLAIETIVRSARTQGELIDDLLDLSRVVAGTLQLDVTVVDLTQIVGEVLVAAKPAADAKNLSLTLTTMSGPVSVRGDERRLRQIVWNLVTNAVKFTEPGGQAAVNVWSTGTMAAVEVADTGRGIDPSFLPHVWDRFRQADSSTSRQYGGLGLGLAVVRHLVEMHGGTVHAHSDGPGHGSTFRAEIPLARPLDARPEASNALPHGEGKMRGLRVLLVEDDADSRSMMTTMLTQFGAQVTPSASVSEALWLLDAQPFDIVVSDIAMPREDGYSLVAQTRSRIPTVAVSAMSTGIEDRRRALEAGFADFVRKPVDPNELVDAVLRALGA